jgi:hypothetical protein
MKVLGYAKVKILLRDGAYTDFTQLADDIGRTILAGDLAMSINTLRKRTNDPGLWTVRELAKFSDLLEIDHALLPAMADAASTPKKKGKK